MAVAGHDDGNETASPRAPDARPGLTITVVGIANVLTTLSASAVTVALPQLAADMSVPIDDAGWVVSGFLLAVTVLLLVAGRISDLVGHRTVYLTGFSLFGAASVLCGLAGSFGLLIAGRVVMGIGGAMIMSASPALLTTAFPPSQRGRALGLASTAVYIGLTAGPPVAGLVVSTMSWRALFFLNVPAAVVVVLLGLRYLPPGVRRARVPFDWGGTATAVLGLPLLVAAVMQARHLGWSSPYVFGGLTAGASLLTAFVVIESRVAHPLLALRLFRSRIFTGATLSALGNYVALFVAIILMPFYLKEGLGMAPERYGFLLAAQPLVMALVATPSGLLSDRLGSRGLATGGLVLLAGGLGGLATLGPQSTPLAIVLWQMLMGLGTGLFISPNSSALMGAAPRTQQGVAGGVMSIARSLGMILGVTLATSLFLATGGRTGHAWAAPDFAAFRAAMTVAAGVCLLSAVAAALRGKREPDEPKG